MADGRYWIGMELARCRAAASHDPAERAAALTRAGDAYEHARARLRGERGEAPPPGAVERGWRSVGRGLAVLLALTPRLRRWLEDRLLACLDPA